MLVVSHWIIIILIVNSSYIEFIVSNPHVPDPVAARVSI